MSFQQRSQRYREAAVRLHGFLERQLSPESGYPDPPSWGYAFSALLSAELGEGKLGPLGERAIRHLANQDAAKVNFPWEFIVYAVQRTKLALLTSVALPFDVSKTKGTRMFNWFLLRRLNTTWFPGHGRALNRLALRLGLWVFCREDGLIQDEFRTRSLQYHTFSLFLLCELYGRYPDTQWLADRIVQGAKLLERSILQDGSGLWIGRGQGQIFGYASQLYAMEFAQKTFHCMERPETLDLIQDYVLGFQRPDGSFPLTLRKREPEPPGASFSHHPPGWYGYNTLYDYLPFLGYLMARVSTLEDHAH